MQSDRHAFGCFCRGLLCDRDCDRSQCWRPLPTRPTAAALLGSLRRAALSAACGAGAVGGLTLDAADAAVSTVDDVGKADTGSTTGDEDNDDAAAAVCSPRLRTPATAVRWCERRASVMLGETVLCMLYIRERDHLWCGAASGALLLFTAASGALIYRQANGEECCAHVCS
jgi:hypothetical protein